MYLKDFKIGDKVKRRGWDTFVELTTNLHFELDLSMEEILANDWECQKKIKHVVKWVNVFPKQDHYSQLSQTYDSIDDANKADSRYIIKRIACIKIEWDEEE